MTPAQAVAHWRQVPARLFTGAELATGRAALFMEGRVKANASGRPGPRAITGNYRASINAQEATSSPLRPEWVIGTPAPQGARLEHGFHDVDSLGRHYEQDPFPHFEPAADPTSVYLGSELRRLRP